MTGSGLVGRWRLSSWLTRDAQGAIGYPFGEKAQGNVIYTAGGWVSVHVAAESRPDLQISVLGAVGSDAERLSSYATYVAYSGRYRLAGDVIVHEVMTSLYPNWVGIELRRSFELAGDRLVLSMPPGEPGSVVSRHELHWTREEHLRP